MATMPIPSEAHKASHFDMQSPEWPELQPPPQSFLCHGQPLEWFRFVASTLASLDMPPFRAVLFAKRWADSAGRPRPL